MADISMHAQRRHATAQRVIDALGLDMDVPSTKHHPVLQQNFELAIIEALIGRIEALEAKVNK